MQGVLFGCPLEEKVTRGASSHHLYPLMKDSSPEGTDVCQDNTVPI